MATRKCKITNAAHLIFWTVLLEVDEASELSHLRPGMRPWSGVGGCKRPGAWGLSAHVGKAATGERGQPSQYEAGLVWVLSKSILCRGEDKTPEMVRGSDSVHTPTSTPSPLPISRTPFSSQLQPSVWHTYVDYMMFCDWLFHLNHSQDIFVSQ